LRLIAALCCLLIAACATSPSELEGQAEAPLTGQDRADRACGVVLRAVAPSLVNGKQEQSCAGGKCWLVFAGTLDVSSPLTGAGTSAAVLYQGAADAVWREAAAQAVDGAQLGMQRYAFRLSAQTIDARSTATALAAARVQIAPFFRGADGARIFDHNRAPGDVDNSALAAGNSFTIADDGLLCTDFAPHQGTVIFRGDFKQEQRGALIPGGELLVDYELYRLPGCFSSTYNGVPAWETTAYVRFLPSGTLVQAALRDGQDATGAWHHKLLRASIPLDATEAQLWFLNSGAHCSSAWDSNFGDNYRFAVRREGPPAPVGWAGDVGGSTSRACEHTAGLPEPITVDNYLLERACLFFDVDVYVPGVTDQPAERPDLILAQAELSRDGAGVHQWLAYVGRFGNNYRYRFTPERELLSRLPWKTWRWAARFSTDGLHWSRVGQQDGPQGGPARTLVNAVQSSTH